MRVVCRTNLDLANEQWPTELPAVPQVGDRIQSATTHGLAPFQLELEVVRVTWKFYRTAPHNERMGEWRPEIELHMTKWQRQLPAKKEGAAAGSIVAFYEWYAPLVGRTVSSFI